MVLLEISILTRVVIGISAMVLLFASFLVAFISNQRKKLKYHKDIQQIHARQQEELQIQNSLLEDKVNQRTQEITLQSEKLQETLSELKASQLQLVQKEKMASLGELTAGIAHEIQNPLNFVNNFAEINGELLAELSDKIKEELLKGNSDMSLDDLIKDLSDNHRKILDHGKRADSIVKNMLQHSRKQVGELELTDINALADEYLKLSYQGYRARHKDFNCILHTSFEADLGLVKIIPQDIGRIIINLFSNSFYSVGEKKKKHPEYNPEVSLSTQKRGKFLILTVRDNGLGISQENIQKIYHPFFTTKPTGEGTGLGLSMSYDIMKAHQGELKVDSVEGEYASFTLEIPI